MSDMLRITGMVSGMDTDATVKKLIQGEQIKVDKAQQEKQYMEWQKEDYREVANLMRGFQDEYFDVLNPATNMKSASTFNMFSGTAEVGGVVSSAVSISTSASSLVGSITIDSVTQLATKDSYKSSSEVLGNITSGVMGSMPGVNDLEAINTQVNEFDNTMSFTFDGVTKEISLEPLDGVEYFSYLEFAQDISARLQDEFTNVDIEASITADNELEFKILNTVTSSEENGHTLEIGSANSDLLNILQLSAGQSNTVNTTKTLADIFEKLEGSEDSVLEINGVSFTFADTTTIDSMMSEINASAAGVTISYDSFSDKFSLESNTVGSDSKIDDITVDTGGLIAAFKLVHDADSGKNAQFVVNKVPTTRSSNTFEINGSSITLNEIPAGEVTIDITSDTSDVKDMIVKFVDSYNEMISKINDMVSTRKNYDYAPLTSEQKESMTDDDIEAWQEEARKGTLSGDASLEKITRDLRSMLYESVDGLGINLYDIGIQTSSSYREQGKLVINETKLDAALKDRPNEVIELFTKQSDTTYSSSADRGVRNSENGMAYRIYDILQDNIRLTRDNNGNKGYLIDKAGLETGTDATSEMAKKLQQMDEKIDDLLVLLGNQEEKYYNQFARMESAMASLSSQSDFLMSQFGG